jgi:hypothetical protein
VISEFRYLHAIFSLYLATIEEFFDLFDGPKAPFEALAALLIGKPDLNGVRSESQIRGVMAKGEAVFGPACEHPIWFFRREGHEVVYEHADIGLISPENEGRLAIEGAARVDARHQALCGGLFVSRCPVGLPCDEESSDNFRLERSIERRRIDIIILDSIGGPDDLCVFQTGDAVIEACLDTSGKELESH